MKKKILIVSLAINIIAGAFVFYSFTSKAKKVNDGGGYLIMTVLEQAGEAEFSISDGNNILDHQDLKSKFTPENIRLNNQIITKKINDLRSQGYEIVLSNSGGYVGNLTHYIFSKK